MTSTLPVEGDLGGCRRGRPRDERIDRGIEESALAVLSEQGFERFSVEAVAQRAGVAKTTIYRRFPTGNELIVGALVRLNDDLPPSPPPGPVRERLIAVLGSVRDRVTTSRRGRILVQVTAESLRDPALAELVHRRVLAPRRALIREVIETGQATGELRADLDPDVVQPLLVGPMLYLGMWNSQESARSVPVAAIVDLVLSGLTPASDS